MAKYIFVTGGVVSSLGKGITAASLGRLLKARGYKVMMQKFDPYLNVDPGTMNPYQHGEVFVTDDGAETDLDLGHYERFIDEPLTKYSTLTSGKVYLSVIEKERTGPYKGATVQVVPHITNEIKQNALRENDTADIVIIEIGGTVGDMESQPFLEAIRQLRLELPPQQTLFIHVTLIPYLKTTREVKTKPTQHSVKQLQAVGIQPDFIICRVSQPLEKGVREKIAMFCNVHLERVLENRDCNSLYEVPLLLEDAGFATGVLNALNLPERSPDLDDWKDMVHRHLNLEDEVVIALAGKYVELRDAFLSIAEALTHGGIFHNKKVNIKWVPADDVTRENAPEMFRGVHGILVPGGFGNRGVEGKIATVEYARKNGIPFFGICLGMQIAVIESLRNVLNLADAGSTEVDPNVKHKIVDVMPDHISVVLGGTMRLGAYDCEIVKDGIIKRAYGGKASVRERHRHRYELNNEYLEHMEQAGLQVVGVNPKSHLVEAVEREDHPWFVGVQYHPEFLSRPNRAHPLFREFIGAASRYKSE